MREPSGFLPSTRTKVTSAPGTSTGRYRRRDMTTSTWPPSAMSRGQWRNAPPPCVIAHNRHKVQQTPGCPCQSIGALPMDGHPCGEQVTHRRRPGCTDKVEQMSKSGNDNTEAPAEKKIGRAHV